LNTALTSCFFGYSRIFAILQIGTVDIDMFLWRSFFNSIRHCQHWYFVFLQFQTTATLTITLVGVLMTRANIVIFVSEN